MICKNFKWITLSHPIVLIGLRMLNMAKLIIALWFSWGLPPKIHQLFFLKLEPDPTSEWWSKGYRQHRQGRYCHLNFRRGFFSWEKIDPWTLVWPSWLAGWLLEIQPLQKHHLESRFGGQLPCFQLPMYSIVFGGMLLDYLLVTPSGNPIWAGCIVTPKRYKHV